MASFQGNKIKDTYQAVLKTADNAALDADGKEITDGAGNGTGITIGTQGNISAVGTVGFGSLKDSGENITIEKFVDEADGISNNDNDTSIPTSAAVKDYVDSYVTAQDLDISDGTNTGSVDLDSQTLLFVGDSGVNVTVSDQTVSVDSSNLQQADLNLQSEIEDETSARSSADTTLQVNINAETSARIAADAVLQDEIDAEASARQSADTALQSSLQANINAEAATRAAADTTLQNNINTESSARIAQDNALQDNIDAEEAARVAADIVIEDQIDAEAVLRAAEDAVLQANIDAESLARTTADATLQSNINAESSARATADTTLQGNITAEASARSAADITLQANIDQETSTRQSADNSLQSQITSNDSDISSLTTRITTAEINIIGNDGDISGLDSRLTTAESNIASNDTDISDLDVRVTAAEGNISSNDTDIAGLDTRLTTAESNISSNDSDISGLDTRLTSAETAITGKQDISEKGQANGYAPLDSGAKIPEANLPDSILGQVAYEGTWDASTNTPTLADPTTVKGHYYIVEVEGTYLSVLYHVGDWVISNGVSWEKVDNTDAVTTVFGRLGAVVANEADYAAFYAPLADYNATASQVSTNTTKLATIEEGADVTDAANVAAAGAMMTDVASLADLSDVAATLPVNGQVLAYNGGTGTWGPVAAASAPVTSVNGDIGAVTLDADDINDAATTNKFVTSTDITKLGNIFVSQLVNLDTLESDVAINNAKISFDSASSTKLAGIEAGAQVNTVDSVNNKVGAVVLNADDIDDTSTVNKFVALSDIDKLAGIEAGADVTDATNVTSALASVSVTAHSDVTSAGSGAIITSAERTKLNGIEAGADVTDTANVVAALTAGSNITIGVDGTISSTDTDTTYSAGAGLSLAGTTFSHADTSSQASVNNSGRTYIQDITLDEYGHITAITSATETVVDTNTTYTAGSGLALSGTTFSHADTSAVATLAASGRRYVTGLTFDTYGHVTGYTTGTETVVDTNTTYSAGAGLTLSGTTFSVQSDLRGEAWLIGRDNNDYINVDTTVIDFVLDGAVDMRLYNNGDLHVEGNVIGYSTSISDQKFKDDVEPIESALDKVKALKGVEFTWNATSKKGKRDIGFIAQEVEEIVPEVVTEVEMGVGEFADEPTTSKSVAYDKLTAILVEAIKEQQKQIDELKAKLDGITN